MSDYVNDALLDASPYKKQAEEAKSLVNKWDKTGLLDGLNEDFKRSGMAVMLENQAKQLINENSATGGGAGTGTAGTAGSEEWSGVALPLVRRIFGEIAAQDFVSVQPMNLPSGLVFYLDFKYGKSNVEGYGSNSDQHSTGKDVESIGGKTGPNTPSGSTAPFGVGGLYGEGKYDYSLNETVTELTLGTAVVGSETAAIASTGSVTYKDINFNQEFSASLAASKLVKVNVAATTIDSKFDKKAFRAVKVVSGSGNVIKHMPQFNTISSDGATVSLIISASAVADLANDKIKVTTTQQPTEAARGDFEDTVGNAAADSLAIPEVDLQLKSLAIVAITRKL